MNKSKYYPIFDGSTEEMSKEFRSYQSSVNGKLDLDRGSWIASKAIKASVLLEEQYMGSS